MSAHRLGLVAEENAFTAISERTVVGEYVVCVFVSNRDACISIAYQIVVFKNTVFDTPAKIEADAAIIFRMAQTNGGVLAAAAWM